MCWSWHRSGIMSPSYLISNISPSPTEKGRALLKAVYLFSDFFFLCRVNSWGSYSCFPRKTWIMLNDTGNCMKAFWVWIFLGLFIRLAVGFLYLTVPLWTCPKESKIKHQWICQEESLTMSCVNTLTATASSQFCRKIGCASSPGFLQHTCTL